ncbi:hypothetical protein EBZ80_12990 [bacterium]|nr:hypothetical protein [bacterium]
MENAASLDIPGSPGLWPRYWKKLERTDQATLIRAGLVTKEGVALARKGWNEFVYAVWMAFCDPATKRELSRLGMTDAADDRGVVQSDHRLEVDPADSELAYAECAEYAEPEEAELMERFGIPLELARKIRGHYDSVLTQKVESRAADMVRQVVGAILCEPNIKVAAFAVSTVFGIPTGFRTQTEFAKAIDVTKATISKKVVELRRALGVRVNAWGKSDAACAMFSKAQKENHWRKRSKPVQQTLPLPA